MRRHARTVEVAQPLTARPQPQAVVVPASPGAIYRTAGYQPLFEDRRARQVGDTLTININEKINASKTASTTANRKGIDGVRRPERAARHVEECKGGNLQADSKNEFDGKGDSAANNVFTGTITVTVIDVLPNGNLLVVAARSRSASTRVSEFIRLSGVVNPIYLTAGNIVSSTQVADARIEYRGTGYIDEAQTMGWLARAFLSVMPF